MTDAPPPSALELLQQAKALAQQYYALTGRPLGITGEVAECEAAPSCRRRSVRYMLGRFV